MRKEYIPEEKEKQNILNEICINIAHSYGYTLDILLDKELNTLFEKALKDIIESLKEEGFNPVTYNESLIILETERLFVRKFVKDDLAALHSILEKPEVMYAWEHGFTKSETRKWLNKQLTRYKKDGYGYFTVILKETDKLIGQVGLMKSEINGQEVVELGYIFDNLYWGNGYCIESVKKCVQFAFDHLELHELYCSIRPNNFSSIHIAEKIGMSKIGEHVVNYRGKEMPHIVYVLRKV